MNFYTNLFSPDTFETFSRSRREVSGFSKNQLSWARRLAPGDRFICYMTKLSRWVGVLEVLTECYVDETPLFYAEDDPYIVRFKVEPLVWLPKEHAVPIHEKHIWDNLSFTRGCNPGSSVWTGKVRTSLNKLSAEDGEFLQKELIAQQANRQSYPVDEDSYRRWLVQKVRRTDKVVPVTVPEDDDIEEPTEPSNRADSIRESAKIQALLGALGEKMGFNVWIPKNDRSIVQREWTPRNGTLVDSLPLNYDETTLQTIEQIDVLWLRGRSIARAFEVEHTTAVYSGILRMADLLALQPNMDIKLHIVAPEARKLKVMNEIQRPVFSLLEKGPLKDYCTFLPYSSLRELAELKHLQYVSDEVLEEYAEGPE
ncbi:MAG: EVE domain-containing protein [Acidobacteria bacterium]|nr:EVE domain-containing protein [Acidobacteriota bacterium]MCI0724773.1 EVE domain-containing protein [Acidobacteriota bacterium]